MLKSEKHHASLFTQAGEMAGLTYPQLRHKEEQVKYSSGKKELCAIWSSGISPLKRSLSACRERKAAREGTWQLPYKLHSWKREPKDFCSHP